MKKSFTIFASIILMTLSANVMAQNTATAEATASATIMTPIAITNSADLAFGKIVNDADGGTVIISAAGVRTLNDGLSAPITVGSYSAASYSITGNPSSTYAITLPNTTTIKIGTDGATMTVGSFTSNLTNSIGTLGSDGKGTITVGATLNVDALQASGDYTGTYDVTVSYN